MCFELENSLGKIGSVAFCSVFRTRAPTPGQSCCYIGVHSQSAAVGGVLMNKMADGSPDEKRQSK